MINPRYYKLYNSHDGEDTKTYKLMYKAQQCSFKTEGMDIIINKEKANMSTGSPDDNYPGDFLY